MVKNDSIIKKIKFDKILKSTKPHLQGKIFYKVSLSTSSLIWPSNPTRITITSIKKTGRWHNSVSQPAIDVIKSVQNMIFTFIVLKQARPFLVQFNYLFTMRAKTQRQKIRAIFKVKNFTIQNFTRDKCQKGTKMFLFY